jgi:hypothetical protein
LLFNELIPALSPAPYSKRAHREKEKTFCNCQHSKFGRCAIGDAHQLKLNIIDYTRVLVLEMVFGNTIFSYLAKSKANGYLDTIHIDGIGRTYSNNVANSQ